MKIVRQPNQPGDFTDQIYNWNGDLYWQGLNLTAAASADRKVFPFARNGPIVNNSWLRTCDRMPSNIAGYPLPLGGNILSVAVVMGGGASTCTIEIWKKGGGAPLVSVPFAGEVTKKVDVSIPVVALEELQAYVNGGPARYPSVIVLLG